MKKLGFLFVCTLFFISSHAQDMKFGLTVSPHMNWFRAETDRIDSKVRVGLKYGAIGEFYFAENYAFAVGVNHVITGGSFQTDGNDYIMFEQGEIVNDEIDTVPQFNDYKLNLQYIEVPLTLKLKTNEIGYLTYYGQIGVTPGVKLKGRVNASSNNQNEDLQNTNVLKDINFINLALTVGGGIEYSLTKDVSLLAGLYYNNGFINSIPKDGGDEDLDVEKLIDKDDAERPKTSDGEKISMKNISLRLGFMF